MSALQEQFVTEARELIGQATDDLIALERDGPSPERIDRVFRAFHTLKGSAGVVELPAMSLMLHAAEDVLAAVKANALGVDDDVIDAALASLDQTARWVDDYESAGALPARASDDGHTLAQRLRSLLGAERGSHPRGAGSRAATKEVAAAVPDWAAGLVAAERDVLTARLQGPSPCAIAVCYEPAAGCFYNGDDPLQLMRRIPHLLALRVAPREPFPPLADVDPYACNLRLEAISAAGRDQLAEIFRLVPDQVRIAEIPVNALQMTQSSTEANHSLIHAILAAQCELLRAAGRQDDFAGCVGAAARVAVNALRHGEHHELADSVERAGGVALAQRASQGLLAAIERALAALENGGSAVAPETPGKPQPRDADAPRQPADRVLRVSEAKIEALVNLASEFVVAKNALSHSVQRVADALGRNDVTASIRRDHDALDRLVVELHGTILQLRMVPVAQVLQSFPRLVRDVARQLDKSVTLETRGGGTEADKTLVDGLFEPLLHLVRNAVDHGVEPRDQRRASGKPESATITIEASRAGDRFLVDISDDGRGIDASAVRRKAAEKRLMPATDLAALTEEQAINLVFAPGFSTAAEISDISGRGVGMDAVRTAIERIGGRVTLTSKPGSGTIVRLDLPMTIAMSRIMVVEAGRQLFGISMDAVSETVRVAPDRISRFKNNLGFVLRERVVPIVALTELMKLPVTVTDATQTRLFVIVEAGSQIAAIEIDAIHDRMDAVLKPMQGLLAGARGYAGTALLGNGQVLLVLDVKEILP